MKSSPLAIDIGRSDTKVIFGDKHLKFPTLTLLGNAAGNHSENSNSPSFNLDSALSIGGSKVPLAEDVDCHFDLLCKNAPLLIARSMTLLGLKACPDSVVVGLPIEIFTKCKNEFANRLAFFQIGKRAYTFKNVIVVLQGAGTLADHMNSNSSGYVVDLGFDSLLALRFENGQILEKAAIRYCGFGLLKPMQKLGEVLREGYGLDFGVPKINWILNGDWVPEDIERKIDLPSILGPIRAAYAEELGSLITNIFGPCGDDNDIVFLSGGGTHILLDLIPPGVKSVIMRPHLPEFMDVMGYSALSKNG